MLIQAHVRLNWASLKVGASKGFLVEVGREIDRELLAFQHLNSNVELHLPRLCIPWVSQGLCHSWFPVVSSHL